jgi:hypothetical protein
MMRLDIAHMALIKGKHDLADQQLALVNGPALSVHGRCSDLAVRILRDVLRDQPCAANALTELTSLVTQLRTRPMLEQATIAVALGLSQRGRAGDAIALVRDYTARDRREPWRSNNPILQTFVEGQPISTAAGIRAAIRGSAYKP